MKELENETANLICNECGALIRTVPIDEAPQILLRMVMDQGMCTETCPHCGAFNVILGFTSVDAFTCRECGQAVSVERRVQ
jgi:ribosomal protein L40E